MVFKPRYAVIATAAQQLEDAVDLERQFRQKAPETELLFGADALEFVAAHEHTDAVMAAIVGAAGLLPTLAAAKAGKQVLLANKESLVVAGELLMQAVASSGAVLLPIDSEHNAIFQCLPADYSQRGFTDCGIHKVLLTGSGGPFRELPLDQFAQITPEQACAHPNWDMGRKISVDSATMMNKGLELIEACHLFQLNLSQIDVLLHPQSIIHSMVSYVDGSVIAQLGQPDMRTPIAYGLSWPERMDAGVKPLDFTQISQLTFEAPCERRYPCLALAKQAYREGANRPTILNAANEEAVAAFLDGRLSFNGIAEVISEVLDQVAVRPCHSIEQLLEDDALARQRANQQISKRG
jgi:1-deoxy-D-xylulose-5-phosphate reductoisomerase